MGATCPHFRRQSLIAGAAFIVGVVLIVNTPAGAKPNVSIPAFPNITAANFTAPNFTLAPTTESRVVPSIAPVTSEESSPTAETLDPKVIGAEEPTSTAASETTASETTTTETPTTTTTDGPVSLTIHPLTTDGELRPGQTLHATMRIEVTDPQDDGAGWIATASISQFIGTATGYAFMPVSATYAGQQTDCSTPAAQVSLSEVAQPVQTAASACNTDWVASVDIPVPADVPPDTYTASFDHAVVRN